MEADRAFDSASQAWRSAPLGGDTASDQRHFIYQLWRVFRERYVNCIFISDASGVHTGEHEQITSSGC
jgi:hypothetical protein